MTLQKSRNIGYKFGNGTMKENGYSKGWYKEADYPLTQLDWEHGQVLPAYEDHWYEHDPYYSSGDIQGPGPGRNWYGLQVGRNGYLTGKKYVAEGGFNPIEWLSMAGEVKLIEGVEGVKAIQQARAFTKEGDYILYFGFKNGKPYIGSTADIIKRYPADKLEEWQIEIFDFFSNHPDVRMPNRGIAIGFEQLVIRLKQRRPRCNKRC